MNDRELVTALKKNNGNNKQLQTELWNRYQNLVHKNWAILRRQLNNSTLILSLKDDFYAECFIAFRKAIDAVNLKKIYNDKWKFIGYYRFYLKNVRADFIEKVLKTSKHEKSFYITSADGTEIARVDMLPDVQEREGARFDPVALLLEGDSRIRCSTAVKSCMSKWDDRRQQIFKWRQQGISKSEIAKRLRVTPSNITYYLQSMRDDIGRALKDL